MHRVTDHVAQGCNSTKTVPYVSVIIPAYNAAGHLERALDSALAQTMPDLEVLVVDDGSTDTTLDVARRVAARNSRVRVLRNERNEGVAVSRNRALDVARGEWIALLDADDAWLPERLEQMLATAGNADIVSDDVYFVRSSLIGLGRPGLWSFLQLHGFIVTGSRTLSILDFVRYDLGLLQPIIRRSFLRRHRLAYKPTLSFAEDNYLYFEALASGARWLQLPQGYYLYYKHGGSAATNRRIIWQSAIEMAQSLLNHPAAAVDETLIAALERNIQKYRGQVAFATAQDALRERRFVELARLLWKDPSNFLLIVRFVVGRIYLRLIWTIRRLRAHHRLL